MLLATESVTDFLQCAAPAVASHVAPSDSLLITLQRQGRSIVAAAPDLQAGVCTERELLGDDTPALIAIDCGTTVYIPDVSAETRWPLWRAATSARGYASAAIVGRQIRDDVNVALCLYARASHAWDAAGLADASACTDDVARSILVSVHSADQAELSADLRRAMESRSVIDQAIGVVMAENRCTAEAAMTILRSACGHRKVKLRAIAATVVEGVSGRAPRGQSTFRPRL